MVNIVIVSHGELANGLLDAASLIVGRQEGMAAIALRETDSIDEFSDRVAQAVQDLNTEDGVLVLVDLLGASPFNVSAKLMQDNPSVQVVTGVNLPMLLETVMQREASSLGELAATARRAGAEGIQSLADLLAQGS